MTLILRSDQKYTGQPLGDINGITSVTDWNTMINFADNRYISNGKELALSAAINYERTNMAWYYNQDGAAIKVDPNVPRVTKSGLLIEQATNNVILNSNNPVSQQSNLEANVFYVYRIIGDGTIDVTHPSSTTATGGVSQGNYGFIKASAAGKATVTITGDNTFAQLSKINSGVKTFAPIAPIITKDAALGTSVEYIKTNSAINQSLGDKFTIALNVKLSRFDRVLGMGMSQAIAQIDFSNGAHIAIANVLGTTDPVGTPPSLRFRLYYNGQEKKVISTESKDLSITIVISVTPERIAIAKNGIFVGSSDYSASTVSDITLGRAADWLGLYSALDGIMTHVATYDRALSDNEITKLSRSWV